jgi:hypothetical protein
MGYCRLVYLEFCQVKNQANNVHRLKLLFAPRINTLANLRIQNTYYLGVSLKTEFLLFHYIKSRR